MHHATLICKLEQGLWSQRFTDPVINLISPKQPAGAAEVVNGFSLYLRILMSLYQFYIHHCKKMEETGQAGTAAPVSGHPALQSQPFTGSSITGATRGHRGTRISISSCCPPSPRQPHLICLVLHAQRRAGTTWSSCCSDSNRWCHTAAKMLQSLRSNTVNSLNGGESSRLQFSVNLLHTLTHTHTHTHCVGYQQKSMWMDTDTHTHTKKRGPTA